MRIRLKAEVYLETLAPDFGRAMAKKVVSINEGTWTTGAFVPTDGVYVVRHREHRLPAEVTLANGDIFPRCEACASPVTFRLTRKQSGSAPLSRFRIQLFQLPVLDQKERAS